MTLRRLAGCLVALAVLLVWLHSLGLRMPYMDQVPVFDADCTTSEASMWARTGGTKVLADVVLHAGRAAYDRSSPAHAV